MAILSVVAYDQSHPQHCLDQYLPSAEFQLQTLVTKNCDFLDNKRSGYAAVSQAQIWVTGHSLVAALASLAGAWLAYYNIAPRKNIILSLWKPQSWQLQIRPATRSVDQQPLEEGCKFPHFPALLIVPTIKSGPYHLCVEVVFSEKAIIWTVCILLCILLCLESQVRFIALPNIRL